MDPKNFQDMSVTQLLEYMQKLADRLDRRLRNGKVKSKLGKKGKKSNIPGSGYFFQTK